MAYGSTRRRKVMAEINVVPYIDVMLVLLIIFMVTTPLLKEGVEVDLPNAPAKPLPTTEKQPEPLIVSVDRAGLFFLNTAEPPEMPVPEDELGARVAQLRTAQPTRRVYVRGDEQVNYGQVINAMVILQKAGVEGIGLITDPPTEPKPAKTAR